MKKYFVLINPASGSINERKIRKVKKILRERDLAFEVFYTSENAYGDKIVRDKFTDRFTHLIVMGGDGSLNDAINGLPDFERPIGVISTGTGNDYVKNFKGGMNVESQLIEILNEYQSEVSLGKCNGKYFINGVGAGFDGQIAHNLTHNRLWIGGHLAYYYHVLKILGGYKERMVRYSIDGEEFETPLLMILGGFGKVFGGGFKLLPHACVTDNHLAIAMIQQLSPLKRFIWLNHIKYGKFGHLPTAKFLKARKLIIHKADLKGQSDGELIGNAPFEIEVCDQKLKFLMRII